MERSNLEGVMITGLRFVVKDGRKILQATGREVLGYNDSENVIGLGQWVEWTDVPLVSDFETHMEECHNESKAKAALDAECDGIV